MGAASVLAATLIAVPPKQNLTLDEAIGSVSRAWGYLEFAMTVILAEVMEVQPETALVISAALDYRHRRTSLRRSPHSN